MLIIFAIAGMQPNFPDVKILFIAKHIRKTEQFIHTMLWQAIKHDYLSRSLFLSMHNYRRTLSSHR